MPGRLQVGAKELAIADMEEACTRGLEFGCKNVAALGGKTKEEL